MIYFILQSWNMFRGEDIMNKIGENIPLYIKFQEENFR